MGYGGVLGKHFLCGYFGVTSNHIRLSRSSMHFHQGSPDQVKCARSGCLSQALDSVEDKSDIIAADFVHVQTAFNTSAAKAGHPLDPTHLLRPVFFGMET